MVARPATIPVTAPSTLGLPKRIHSATIQTNAPAAADMCVAAIAMAASPLAASALPPLKPNHPTHNMPAPMTVKVRLCGGLMRSGKPRREPIVMAATIAAVPQVMCTTEPPAKSMKPISLSPSAAPDPMANRRIDQ